MSLTLTNTTTTSKVPLLIAATHGYLMNIATRPQSTSGHKQLVSHEMPIVSASGNQQAVTNGVENPAQHYSTSDVDLREKQLNLSTN